MKKEMNNKGFSLVELIVVIAIMAVLVGVLAPQFLRYVERSRLQKDNQAIGEIANAAKSALAQENVNDQVGNNSITYAYSSGGLSGSASGFKISSPTASGGTTTDFVSEMTATVGAEVRISSKTYGSGHDVEIVITNSPTGVSVSANNYIENVTNPIVKTNKGL